MRSITLYILLLLTLFPLQSLSKDNKELTLGLIPYPNKIEVLKGEFYLKNITKLYCDIEDYSDVIELFKKNVENYTRVETVKSSKKADIIVSINSTLSLEEAYVLDISRKQINIEVSSSSGLLYALMTLNQLFDSHYNTRLSKMEPLECLRIDDSPRYKLRALMLDPARHFLPKEDVMAYIDNMSRYKFNTLQLHLTDDQAWRIEIKKYPQLTKITESRQVRSRAKREILATRGFYTQEDLKEIVSYAAKRNVTIIPEIDIPGHTAAFLAAFPSLRMESQRDSSFVLGRVDNVMLSAVNDSTYIVLDDIFRELSTIFPKHTTLHLGGDESAIARNWAKSASHQELMKKLGLSRADELMAYFFSKIYPIVDKYSFKILQWCELDNVRMPAHKFLMPYPKNVSLISWRMGLSPKCIELCEESSNPLILACGESSYLDYPQYSYDLPEYNNWGMPITTLERSYNFDINSGISKRDSKVITGVMATLWGEAIANIDRAYYMTYPRALAISEIAWTVHKQRSWERFKLELPFVLNSLEKRAVAHRRPVELYKK